MADVEQWSNGNLVNGAADVKARSSDGRGGGKRIERYDIKKLGEEILV